MELLEVVLLCINSALCLFQAELSIKLKEKTAIYLNLQFHATQHDNPWQMKSLDANYNIRASLSDAR